MSPADSAAVQQALSCLHSLDDGQTETNQLLERIASALESIAATLDILAEERDE